MFYIKIYIINSLIFSYLNKQRKEKLNEINKNMLRGLKTKMKIKFWNMKKNLIGWLDMEWFVPEIKKYIYFSSSKEFKYFF